jgi:hypothetical protein
MGRTSPENEVISEILYTHIDANRSAARTRSAPHLNAVSWRENREAVEASCAQSSLLVLALKQQCTQLRKKYTLTERDAHRLTERDEHRDTHEIHRVDRNVPLFTNGFSPPLRRPAPTTSLNEVSSLTSLRGNLT